MTDLLFSASELALWRGERRLDPWTLTWNDAQRPGDLRPIGSLEALAWLYREGGARRLPVAVIGPKAANAEQMALAEELGRALAEAGLTLLTGGKNGVMEAASKGAFEAGGLTLGLIPDEDWRAGNAFVGVPLATGIGPARNALIARAAQALIAIGGEYGTLTEMAFGKHFDKPVFALGGAPAVPGVVVCASVEEVLERLAEALLAAS